MAGATSIVEANRKQHTYFDIGLIPHGMVWFRISPPVTATAQITADNVAAIFQSVKLASANSDGRLITGPAKSSAAAVPIGPPAAMIPSANGISKNVGSAIGTAIEATTMTAKERK